MSDLNIGELGEWYINKFTTADIYLSKFSTIDHMDELILYKQGTHPYDYDNFYKIKKKAYELFAHDEQKSINYIKNNYKPKEGSWNYVCEMLGDYIKTASKHFIVELFNFFIDLELNGSNKDAVEECIYLLQGGAAARDWDEEEWFEKLENKWYKKDAKFMNRNKDVSKE